MHGRGWVCQPHGHDAQVFSGLCVWLPRCVPAMSMPHIVQSLSTHTLRVQMKILSPNACKRTPWRARARAHTHTPTLWWHTGEKGAGALQSEGAQHEGHQESRHGQYLLLVLCSEAAFSPAARLMRPLSCTTPRVPCSCPRVVMPVWAACSARDPQLAISNYRPAKTWISPLTAQTGKTR